MSPDRPTELRAVLAFYMEAGVDAFLADEPVDRLAAEMPQPRAASAAKPAQTPGAADHGDGPQEARRVRPQSPRVSMSPAAPEGRFDVGAPAWIEAPAPPDAAIMAAREAAASATSLDVLRTILDRFEGCGLRLTAKRLVFADGNPQARVMFVGEAPGRDEDAAGLPFVGRSGQLLDRMMAAIGLDRSSAYIANVIPWRPPGNRTPTPQESQICLPFIRRQIELANPDFLVCLGGPSAQTLHGIKDGIRRARGRWHVYDTGSREIRAIATFHPAYLLRTPIEKRFAWRDFLAIKQALDDRGRTTEDR
jgi:uracil-DNA glycosylase family 4